MTTSGQPREGWMAIIPASVFVIFVVIIMGGPNSLLNTMGVWADDVVTAVAAWLKGL